MQKKNKNNHSRSFLGEMEKEIEFLFTLLLYRIS